MLNRRKEEQRQARLVRTKAEIAGRIRCVCPNMQPGEFEALLEQMATIQIKYTLRRSDDLFPEIQPDGSQNQARGRP